MDELAPPDEELTRIPDDSELTPLPAGTEGAPPVAPLPKPTASTAAPQQVDYGDEIAPLLSKEEIAKQAQTLGDPYAGQRAQYEQQRAAENDLIRSSFKATADPGVSPELRDLQVAKALKIPLGVVKANRSAWATQYAQVNSDPEAWRKQFPLSAKLVLDHPELADHVVADKDLNILLKGWGIVSNALDSAVNDTIADAQSVFGFGAPFETAFAHEAGVPAPVDDSPKKTEEVDDAEAAAIRESGAAAIVKQRAAEGLAQIEVSGLYSKLLHARALGRDTTALEAEIYDAELSATPKHLDEHGWQQALSESVGTSMSTLSVLKNSAMRGSIGATAGAVVGGAVGGFAGKSPAAVAAGAAEGASILGRAGLTVGAAEGSFIFESGDSYKQLLNLKTDTGQQLTEPEARGGALLAASIKTGIELVELGAMRKALGPAGGFMGGGMQAVTEMLATNPGFRALATKAAKAWVGEGLEEVAQEAADEAVSYIAASKHDAAWQKGPIFSAEALKENFVGGLMGGALFGAGALVVSSSSHAVFKSKEQHGALQAPELAKLAAHPSVPAMATDVAQLVRQKTAEAGDEVTHVYLDPHAFRRLFQTETEAEAKAKELIGEDGQKKLAEAMATGTRVEVPLEQYLEKFGKDDVAGKLKDDTATQATHETPNELKAKAEENEKWAQKIAAGEEQSPTLERFNKLEAELVATQTHTPSEAKAAMQPLRDVFDVFAKKFGKDAEDLFRDVRIMVDDGSKALRLEHRKANASELLSAEIHDEKGLRAIERARRLYEDPVSGLRTRRAWEESSRQEGKQIAVITSPDVKAINDHIHGGHDTANGLLRTIGKAIGGADTEAARSGTNFILHVRDEAHLAEVLAAAKKALPSAKLGIEGALAPTLDEAFKKLDDSTEAKRKAGTLPARGTTRFDLSKLQQTTFSAKRATPNISQQLIGRAGAMSRAQFFKAAYLDPHVPGVLSSIAWNNLPRKKWVASIDIKGLKDVNALGKGVGDRLLRLFAQVAERNDASDFDFAHLSGDEYAAQHDDPEKLRAWLAHIDAELQKVGFEVKDVGVDGKTKSVRISPRFRSGVGEKTYGAADRVLNAAKLKEKSGTDAGGRGDLARGSGAEGEGGSQVLPARYERRGAPEQRFVDREGASASDARRIGGTADGDARAAVEATGHVPGEAPGAQGLEAVDSRGVGQAVSDSVDQGGDASFNTAAFDLTPEQIASERAAIAQMKDADKRVRATAWVDFCLGEGERPPADRQPTDAMIRHFEGQGIVSPEGPLFDESGKRLDKPLAGAKNKGNRLTGEEYRAFRDQVTGSKTVLGPTPGGKDYGKKGGGRLYSSNGFIDVAREGIDRVFRIGLQQNANKSTFLHESAHVFLELFADLAGRADAPESVRADFETTLKWLGVTNAEEIQTEHHEKWARAFEAYLAEGRAPSDRLAGSFQRFKLWMNSVYRTLSHLGTVGPEIRGVFDRLLATDREIEATKAAMGLRALPREALGMTGEEYAAHLDNLEQASSHASQVADFQVARDKLRETEAWWKAEKAKRKTVAEDEYEAFPARIAQQVLSGKPAGDWLGVKLPLSRAVVESMVGKKDAAKFHVAADGIHPDEFADMLGYATGKGMLEAVLKLPEKDKWVDQRAEDRMREDFPGVLDERTQLREIVAEGLHGEKSRRFVLKEWAALHAKGPRGAQHLPPANVVERAAEIMAAGREAGRLGVHDALVAERTAANNAEKAALLKNYELAAVYKQQQLLNMYLHDALVTAKKEVDQFLDKAHALSQLKARQRLGKADPLYRDAVDTLLAVFDLRDPEVGLNKSLGEVLSDVERLMNEDQTPVGFDRARIVDRAARRGMRGWGDLPMEDLRQVFRALKNIEAAARNRSTVMLDEKRADKEVVIEGLEREAELLDQRPPSPTREAETTLQGIGRRWNRYDGSLLQIETMSKWLSGGKDTAAFLKSFWFRSIIKPMQDGKHREIDLYRKHIEPIVKVFEAIPKKTQSRMMEKIDGRALFPSHIADKLPTRRFEILMMLLNSGNASNLERLTEGRNITEQQLRDAAEKVGVTKEEYAWLQSIWDAAEALKPLAFDLEERDSGVRPEEIVARPFQTPHGEVKGGYFPAVYDRDVTMVGKKQEASLADFADQSYTSIGTQHNFLKARVDGFTDVISLSPGSINRHFAQVAHDVAFREPVKSVGTLLLDARVQALLRERLGEGRAVQFVQWAKDVASMRGVEGSVNAQEMMEWARAVRGNVVTAVLGYKLPNAAEDFTSNLTAAIAATDLKARHLAAAFSEFVGSPRDTRELALGKSGELRARQGQVARDLAKQIKALTASGIGVVFHKGPLAFYKTHAFAIAEAVDVATATPIWLGAYRQALEVGAPKGGVELSAEANAKLDAEAVTFADATVRQALVSHSAVDLSGLMRDKGVIGHLTMFFGAFNKFYNQFRDAQHQFSHAEEFNQKAKIAGAAVGLAVGIFLMGSLARGQGPAPDEAPEDWVFRKLMLEGLLQMFPGVNAAAQVVSTHMQGKKVEARNNSLYGVAEAVAESLFTLLDDEKDAGKRVRAFFNALGPVTGLPTAAPLQSGGPLLDWAFDESQWRNPFDAASDLFYGKKENQGWNPLQGIGDALAGETRN